MLLQAGAANSIIGGEVVAALIGAVVGGIVALFAGFYKDYQDRTRRRRTLATVLLCELRSADASLRSLHGALLESRTGMLPTKAFQVFESKDLSLELFEPATARLILDFATKLSGVRDLLDDHREGRVHNASAHRSILLALVAGSVGLAPTLKEALEDEGGEYIPYVTPEMSESQDGESTRPTLIDSPFPDIGSQSIVQASEES